MATVAVSILGPVAPSADVLTLESRDQFIVIRLGEDASVIGPGVNGEQVAYARALAAVLMDAAAVIERTLEMATSEAPHAD